MRLLACAIILAGCTSIEPIEWIHIPAGEGVVGSDLHEGLGPQMMVEFPEFWITKREITVAQFQQCPKETCEFVDQAAVFAMQAHDDAYSQAGNTGASCVNIRYDGDNKPQVCITHSEARAFAEFMGARLPSEAEWEYVARGGPEQREWWVDIGVDPQATSRPTRCGVKDVSPQGVCHLSGGPREMVADSASPDDDRWTYWPAPAQPASTTIRDWILKPGMMSRANAEATPSIRHCPLSLWRDGIVAGRQSCHNEISGASIGFRLVRDTQPPGWEAP